MRWPWRKSEPEERQLQALRDAVTRTPAELPIDHVLPVLVPASFFALGNWPGPYELLQVEGLGLTWAVLQPEQTMVYVSGDTAAYWEAGGLDWRALAMSNLRRASQRLWTHEFRADPGTLYAAAMMHDDGLGPARLLLRDELQRAFPQGYLVAIPERSCGFVVSAGATEGEQAKVAEVVTTCYVKGTAPVLDGFHPGERLNIAPAVER